jgi:hypothetical protein
MVAVQESPCAPIPFIRILIWPVTGLDGPLLNLRTSSHALDATNTNLIARSLRADNARLYGPQLANSALRRA